MQGYRTLVVGLLSIIGGLATMMGVTLDPQVIADIASNVDTVVGGGMALYGLVMIIFRAFTKSPMLKKPE